MTSFSDSRTHASTSGPIIVRTSDEFTALSTSSAGSPALIPRADQILVYYDTGVFKRGDGLHTPDDLAPLPGGGGSSDASWLSGFGNGTALTQGTSQISLPWTLDTVEGADITIDGNDSTLIHVTAGAYLFQIAAPATSSTIDTSVLGYQLVAGTWLGGDGPASVPVAGTTAWAVWWLYASTAASIRFKATYTSAAVDDTASNGVDVIRLGG